MINVIYLISLTISIKFFFYSILYKSYNVILHIQIFKSYSEITKDSDRYSLVQQGLTAASNIPHNSSFGCCVWLFQSQDEAFLLIPDLTKSQIYNKPAEFKRKICCLVRTDHGIETLPYIGRKKCIIKTLPYIKRRKNIL